MAYVCVCGGGGGGGSVCCLYPNAMQIATNLRVIRSSLAITYIALTLPLTIVHTMR